MSNVQVHADATSMEAYLPVVGELIGEVLQGTRTKSVDVFGTPRPRTPAGAEAQCGAGGRVHLQPRYLHGFTRPATD